MRRRLVCVAGTPEMLKDRDCYPWVMLLFSILHLSVFQFCWFKEKVVLDINFNIGYSLYKKSVSYVNVVHL